MNRSVQNLAPTTSIPDGTGRARRTASRVCTVRRRRRMNRSVQNLAPSTSNPDGARRARRAANQNYTLRRPKRLNQSAQDLAPKTSTPDGIHRAQRTTMSASFPKRLTRRTNAPIIPHRQRRTQMERIEHGELRIHSARRENRNGATMNRSAKNPTLDNVDLIWETPNAERCDPSQRCERTDTAEPMRPKTSQRRRRT